MGKWTQGDIVWIYDEEFTQCYQAVIIGELREGEYSLSSVTYTNTGKAHQNPVEYRLESQIWGSVEEAARAVAEDFRDELLQNSISWYDEQQDWKKLHDEQKSQPEV